jgi:hypothetical protein
VKAMNKKPPIRKPVKAIAVRGRENKGFSRSNKKKKIPKMMVIK